MFNTPKNTDRIILPNTVNIDTLYGKITKEYIHQAKPQAADFAKFIRTNNDAKTVRKIWEYCRQNFTYKFDGYPDSPEIVRMPNASFADKAIDCEDFVILIAATLLNLKIPFIVRFASYSHTPTCHIYLIALIKGRKVILDPCNDKYNQEFKGTFWDTYYDENGKIGKIIRGLGQAQFDAFRMGSIEDIKAFAKGNPNIMFGTIAPMQEKVQTPMLKSDYFESKHEDYDKVVRELIEEIKMYFPESFNEVKFPTEVSPFTDLKINKYVAPDKYEHWLTKNVAIPLYQKDKRYFEEKDLLKEHKISFVQTIRSIFKNHITLNFTGYSPNTPYILKNYGKYFDKKQYDLVKKNYDTWGHPKAIESKPKLVAKFKKGDYVESKDFKLKVVDDFGIFDEGKENIYELEGANGLQYQFKESLLIKSSKAEFLASKNKLAFDIKGHLEVIPSNRSTETTPMLKSDYFEAKHQDYDKLVTELIEEIRKYFPNAGLRVRKDADGYSRVLWIYAKNRESLKVYVDRITDRNTFPYYKSDDEFYDEENVRSSFGRSNFVAVMRRMFRDTLAWHITGYNEDTPYILENYGKWFDKVRYDVLQKNYEGWIALKNKEKLEKVELPTPMIIKDTDGYVQAMMKSLRDNKKENKISSQNLAKTYNITIQTEVKELTELAIVYVARELAHQKNKTVEEKYEEIVKLYKNQVRLNHRSSESIMFQQYSTPAPISYLMGVFCGIDKPGNYFEPSAGNGLLTIAGNAKDFKVNEISDLRYQNLLDYKEGYKSVTKFYSDVVSYPETQNYKKSFDAVITNPPFGKLKAKLAYGQIKVNKLDHLMALLALECMKDDGKCAIILGGHTTFDEKGRIKAKTSGGGQGAGDRYFFSYLYHHYNVKDIILVDGDLYARQGTSFDVRVVLIDGRKVNPSGFAPLKDKMNTDVVKTFEDLYSRFESDMPKVENDNNSMPKFLLPVKKYIPVIEIEKPIVHTTTHKVGDTVLDLKKNITAVIKKITRPKENTPYFGLENQLLDVVWENGKKGIFMNGSGFKKIENETIPSPPQQITEGMGIEVISFMAKGANDIDGYGWVYEIGSEISEVALIGRTDEYTKYERIKTKKDFYEFDKFYFDVTIKQDFGKDGRILRGEYLVYHVFKVNPDGTVTVLLTEDSRENPFKNIIPKIEAIVKQENKDKMTFKIFGKSDRIKLLGTICEMNKENIQKILVQSTDSLKTRAFQSLSNHVKNTIYTYSSNTFYFDLSLLTYNIDPRKASISIVYFNFFKVDEDGNVIILLSSDSFKERFDNFLKRALELIDSKPKPKNLNLLILIAKALKLKALAISF